MSNGNNIFVFVVCGGREHIDTLHFSLQALKQCTKNEILIVTDSGRNEITVKHSNVIDVKTPEHLNNHQASIYLKTALHKFVPAGNNYCYLDTDVVALDRGVDEIFAEFKAPILFAADHCLMDQFSPSAVKCGCTVMYQNWVSELAALFKKYNHVTRPPENLEKKEKLMLLFDEMKQHRLKYALTTVKFLLSPVMFKLHDDAFLDKKKEVWVDAEGNPILYVKANDAVAAIEATSDYRCDRADVPTWTINGFNVYDCRCNHLQQQIQKTFGIEVTDERWQHWNGGVFLFNERSHAFLNAWHDKTMAIFNLPDWTTRDQGTLIATAWEFNLQNQKRLPVRFNLIADYNHLTMVHKGGLIFDIDEKQKNIKPHFIHVYHHWADKQWDVWQAVERQTGIFIK